MSSPTVCDIQSRDEALQETPLSSLSSSTGTRSGPPITFAKEPLEKMLDTLTQLSLVLSTWNAEACESGSVSTDREEHFSAFLQTSLLVLEELDAEDDIQFSLSNKDTVFKVQSILKPIAVDPQKYLKVITLDANQSDNHLHEGIAAMWKRTEELLDKILLQLSASGDWTDCQQSLDAIDTEEKRLRAMLFQLEEQRHVVLPAVSLDLDVLTTILEEAPEGENTGTPGKKVYTDGLSQWDRCQSETLLKLHNKMRPLKVSINLFAPRLAAFASRAAGQFPSAVAELSARYKVLITTFDLLVSERDKLKRELNKDKWMAVFRQVKKQASDMMNSLERTLKKLDAVSFNAYEAVPYIESFEIKEEYYSKSVPAVLSIMQRGVKHRGILSAEVLKGYELLTLRWAKLSIDLADMKRRVSGARIAGIVYEILPVPGRSFLSTSTIARGAREGLPREELRSSKRPAIAKSPLKAARYSSIGAPSQPASPSASFRKDTSLDAPRSHSRLSHNLESRLPLGNGSRPPWNAGTVARLSAKLSPQTSPSRSPSRMSVGRSGAASSLGFGRPETPCIDYRRTTGSLLPVKSPQKTSANNVSPISTAPRQATLERLSRPKGQLPRVETSRIPPVPSTPSRLSMNVPRPKTPTSIPMSRRMVSNPMTPARSKLPTAVLTTTSNNIIRPGSALAARRQSSIPMPSPHKVNAALKLK